MYAIIETGGKQLCVSEGKTFRVDKLAADTGSEVSIDKVLMVGGSSFSVGAPYVSGAKVTAEVVDHFRGEKIIVFKITPLTHHYSGFKVLFNKHNS